MWNTGWSFSASDIDVKALLCLKLVYNWFDKLVTWTFNIYKLLMMQ